MTTLGQGAEAIITKEDSTVIKHRASKSYRHPDLDQKLRKSRTRREAKILAQLTENTPKFISSDDKEMTIQMEYIEGEQLRDTLIDENASAFAQKIGLLVRSIHDQGIIHGDLTTSNILVQNNNLVLIDFGLSFFSETLEDRAVDLHLLMHALHAKHPNLDIWDTVLTAYNPDEDLLARFEEVESRGRYKGKK